MTVPVADRSLDTVPATDSPFETVERFDRIERAVHWATAVIMIELLVTGAILYVPDFAVSVGHRLLVENIHVYSGLALLVPLIAGLVGPWRKELLNDLRRFDRWTGVDWAWFRRRTRKAQAKVAGKFNGGQKLEAILLGAGMVIMLATGTIMRFAPASWITFQQGATLVHDVGFIALGAAVLGHLYYALGSPEQMKSMLTGRISRRWAKSHAPAWLDGSELIRLRVEPPPPSNAHQDVAAAAGRTPVSG